VTDGRTDRQRRSDLYMSPLLRRGHTKMPEKIIYFHSNMLIKWKIYKVC
jgi:hypothetical protein